MKKGGIIKYSLFLIALFNLVICKKYLVELEESDELNVRVKKTKKSNFTGGELEDSDEVRNLHELEKSKQSTQECKYKLWN